MPIQRNLIAAGLTVLLGACGGSQADITGTGDAPEGNEQGEVQGYGSIIVNGTHYETQATTQILIDGQPASQSDLALGMIVDVNVAEQDLGIDGSIARRVRAQAVLEGNIDSIDTQQRSLRIFQLPVRTSLLTRLYDADGNVIRLAQLEAGHTVRVGGFRFGDGSIMATIIQLRASRSDGFLMHGRVSALDDTRMAFELNTLVVDYSAATVLVPDDELEDGDLVAVRGNFDSQSGVFSAERVEQRRDAQDRPDRIGLQGVIRAADGACPQRRILVDSYSVSTDANTRYRRGDCADLEVRRQVKLLARRNAQGDLVAEQLFVAPPLNAFVAAELEGASSSADGCQLQVLGGLVIDVDRQTRQGPDMRAGKGFSCADALAGDAVLAAGEFLPSESAAPDRLHALLLGPGASFDGAPAEFQGFSLLGGAVQRLDRAGRSFELLGRRVQISDDTDFGDDSSEQAFFERSSAGDSVSAAGRWNGAFIEALAVRRQLAKDFD